MMRLFKECPNDVILQMMKSFERRTSYNANMKGINDIYFILFQDGVFFITLYYSKMVYFLFTLYYSKKKKKCVSFILCKNKCCTECSMRRISVKGGSKKCSNTKLIAAILKSDIEC